LGAEHGGKIELGKPAFFLVYAENPLQGDSSLFQIESVVLSGKLVYSRKNP